MKLTWRPDDEHGYTMVMFALVVSIIMIVAALAIDGGEGYTARRQMQNAADAGASAGTLALHKAQLARALGSGGSTDITDVYSQTLGAVQGNFGSAPTNAEVVCQVVQSDGVTPVGNGDCRTSANVLDTSASGVRVVSERVRSTYFGRFAGQGSMTIRARSTATAQPPSLANFTAPFLVCGVRTQDDNGNPVSGRNLFDPAVAPSTIPTLNVARAQQYWGLDPPNASASDLTLEQNANADTKCQNGASSFDGHGDPGSGMTFNPSDGTYTATAGTGNGLGNVPPFADVSGYTNVPSPACIQDIPKNANLPCYTVLPIIEPNSAQSPPMACNSGNGNCHVPVIGLAVFKVFAGSGSKHYVGRFIDIAKGGPQIPVLSTGNCASVTNGFTCQIRLRL
jgi:Flp pilus assembly protein TadG